jgi:2-dehydro-3-deoxyglucarate aldolase/4-hydroxy-2-oxoheptanedioate aldolase
VKAKLAAGGRAFGVMLYELATPNTPRVLDAAGAEFAIWDLEHTGWTTDTLRNVLAAARLGSTWPLVRVPRARYELIATALDAGSMGVMVPMVETAEQARLVVESVKYPPVGRRGFGALYPDQTADGGPAGWMERSNAETLVICQIETAAGLENANEIIGTDGLDIPWLGHYDLTASLGIPGRFEHRLYQDAIERLRSLCEKHGKALGMMVTTPEQGRAMVEFGFRAVAYGDVWLLVDSLRAEIDAVRAAAAERELA